MRIDERGSACARDAVDGLLQRNLPVQSRPDDLVADHTVIRDAAPMGIAIALDQPGAFGDLERERR